MFRGGYIDVMPQEVMVNIGALGSFTNILLFAMMLIIVAVIWYFVWTYVHH
jgi:hypothetical protein